MLLLLLEEKSLETIVPLYIRNIIVYMYTQAELSPTVSCLNGTVHINVVVRGEVPSSTVYQEYNSVHVHTIGTKPHCFLSEWHSSY